MALDSARRVTHSLLDKLSGTGGDQRLHFARQISQPHQRIDHAGIHALGGGRQQLIADPISSGIGLGVGGVFMPILSHGLQVFAQFRAAHR